MHLSPITYGNKEINIVDRVHACKAEDNLNRKTQIFGQHVIARHPSIYLSRKEIG